MKIAVIGAGSWGTALAQLLANNGNDVHLWARRDEIVQAINTTHHNPDYLADAALSPAITATTSYQKALSQAQCAVIVTPSQIMRDVARTLAKIVDQKFPLVICSKGIEAKTGFVPAHVFDEEMNNRNFLAALCGPNHAEEVVRGVPSGTVIASFSGEIAKYFQKIFASPVFRTYTSDDLYGVELCAAFKNVIAIAIGISYGLGYGDNTAAMLMTRGIAEMSRLVQAAGGNPLTCMGLAGAGDLIVTCTSVHSRNRRLGELIAQGHTLTDFGKATHMVAEGAYAAQTFGLLAQRYHVELPIAEMVYGMVWEGLSPHEVETELVTRPLKPEFY